MSRAINILEKLVSFTGYSTSAIKSISVTNKPKGEDGTLAVMLSFKFENGRIDEFLYKALLTIGSYSSDELILVGKNRSTREFSRIKEVSIDEKVEALELFLTNEVKPITTLAIINSLTTTTLFGLPDYLIQGVPISALKIFFGVNRDPIKLTVKSHGNPSAHEGKAYTFSSLDKSVVRFKYLDKNNILTSKDVPVKSYLSEALRVEIERHSYKPKLGLLVDAAFAPTEFDSDVPFLNWISLRKKVEQIVQKDLDDHLKAQVGRISARIQSVHTRTRLYRGGVDFGLVPNNEVETVLLFQKLLHLAPDAFPPGFTMQILDYSPRDIDAISQFQLSSAHPLATGPVEFEYAIKSFFDHGHDYRQVEMIVCYKIGEMQFPYSKGGVEYKLQPTGALPTLTNSFDTKTIPCLILERMFQ